ncbi:hypothetical protein LUX01_19960 [Streptomyces sudanensis]|uniref:hypothetical protein n=1 Tax=Streptomyces sudanensis TaxID=436397 RepID=UPI0020CE35B5|nr:hypothetical protein [Streptomyces sudanensis]MCP9988614.1 hypothetical protein [Streptomyces sudanensis]
MARKFGFLRAAGMQKRSARLRSFSLSVSYVGAIGTSRKWFITTSRRNFSSSLLSGTSDQRL